MKGIKQYPIKRELRRYKNHELFTVDIGNYIIHIQHLRKLQNISLSVHLPLPGHSCGKWGDHRCLLQMNKSLNRALIQFLKKSGHGFWYFARNHPPINFGYRSQSPKTAGYEGFICAVHIK